MILRQLYTPALLVAGFVVTGAGLMAANEALAFVVDVCRWLAQHLPL